MITIIHGDDIKASRAEYVSLKEKHTPHVALDGGNFDLTDLVEALTGDGLFDENKTVFIEQFFSKRKKSKTLDELISTINSYSEKEIIFFEGKELDKKTVASFPKAVVHVHKLPQVLFTFLDSLQPGNSRVLLPLFHEVLKTSEMELLFSMMIRQFRILLAISDAADSPIDEVKRLAPWQQQKLRKQASLFTQDQLVDVYDSLFEIEYSLKTGRLSLALSSTIDFWLLRL